tara:strand:+ start:674 stop:1819 length:1146 start_codon:yes stop_codon:yes gene_type:complete
VNIFKKKNNINLRSHSIQSSFLFIILLIIIYFFDLYVLCFYGVLVLVSYLNIAQDNKELNNINADTHGISINKSSRLGGLLILLFLILNLSNTEAAILELFNKNQLLFYFIITLFISFLGFADDLLGGLHHLLKLYCLFFAILILLITNNNFLVSSSGVLVIDIILQNKEISFFITLIIISGFINASNISDGANGILSGIGVIFSYIFFLETRDYTFFLLFKFLFIFFLYNILIAKVFLGDAGSYFLGFFISTLALYYYNTNLFSAGFLASLLSYPCIEISYAIIRRINMKQNPLRPDNKHLHNMIFVFLKKKYGSIEVTNSLTGIIINLFFSVPCLMMYLSNVDTFNIYFWYLFIFQIFIYFLFYAYLINAIKNNNYYNL